MSDDYIENYFGKMYHPKGADVDWLLKYYMMVTPPDPKDSWAAMCRRTMARLDEEAKEKGKLE